MRSTNSENPTQADELDANVQHESIRAANVGAAVSRSPSSSPVSPSGRLPTDLRITISRSPTPTNKALFVPEIPFQSKYLQAMWDYTKSNSINSESKAAKAAILNDIKSRNSLEIKGRPPEDDGILRSFDHVLTDATFNVALALLRYDRMAEGRESQTTKSLAASSPPWAIHYKTELSKLMLDSGKFFKSFKFNSSSNAEYKFEMDRIIHILNPVIEKKCYGVDMDLLELRKFKETHKTFFEKAKKNIEGGKSEMSFFDANFQVTIMVCVGLKEPLGNEALQNVIDYYLRLFDELQAQQIKHNLESIKLLEELQSRTETEELKLTAFRNKQFPKLTAANITIFLMPFDGVNKPLSEVEKIAEDTLDQWVSANLNLLKDKYSGINIYNFTDFQKTIYFQMALYLMQVYLISNQSRIIEIKPFETDISSYLKKVVDDDAIALQKIDRKKFPRSNSNSFKEDKNEMTNPHHLAVLPYSPVPTTATPLPASPDTALSIHAANASPPYYPNRGAIDESMELSGGSERSLFLRASGNARISRSTQITDGSIRVPSQSQSPEKKDDPVLVSFFSFLVSDRLDDSKIDNALHIVERRIVTTLRATSPVPNAHVAPIAPTTFPGSFVVSNNRSGHFAPRKSQSLPGSPERNAGPVESSQPNTGEPLKPRSSANLSKRFSQNGS
jgi:hypothetical protein